MISFCALLSTAVLSAVLSPGEYRHPVEDTPFIQEYHEAFPLETEDANNVHAIAVDSADTVWAATAAGVYVLEGGQGAWRGVLTEGPAFALAPSENGILIGAWDGVYQGDLSGVKKIEASDIPVTALYAPGERAALDLDVNPLAWACEGENACPKSIHAVVPGKENTIWLATSIGLFHWSETEVRRYLDEKALLSSQLTDLAYDAEGRLWITGLGGVTIYKGSRRVAAFEPKDGLPTVEAQSVDRGPDGRMWVGTTLGVTRYDGESWSLRHSKRWLLNNEVRGVAFSSDGSAWIATAGGVSAIRQKAMTLHEKAQYFQEVTMARHVRPPFIVEKCRLKTPGDRSAWEPEDDDNDGGYTAFYMVGEAFRYAVTGAEDARQNARKCFELLQFLQQVTKTGGFFARTVVPAHWTRMHDPNHVYTEQERAEWLARDPRYKFVEKRWRPTDDGKWLWKGDTSSDEVTAQFYGFFFYHELVADEAEKAEVADLARRIMDYIIDHGYVFVDPIDGTHTRWGVWAPEKLNHDPHWRAERGINSLEILSFLKTTYHLTGDEKYQREYLKLYHDHNYKRNVEEAKTYATAWMTHIDTELLNMAYPALLLLEKDPKILRVYRKSLDYWYKGVKVEYNPFGSFLYALMTGEKPALEDGVFMLRDTPLDLISWRIDNSTREDLTLKRSPIMECIQTGRLLPPSERATIRWDKNPWTAVLGHSGRNEWAPSFWLAPYWIGRYCGFILPPDPS